MRRYDRATLLPAGAPASLFVVLTANFVLFGASMTIFGAAIPKILRLYSWSYSEAGLVLAASSVGYFTSTFISGFLVKRVGSRYLVFATLATEGLSLLFFARLPSVALNAGLNFLIGFGQGGTEVVSNVTVIRLERDGKSRLMNLLHASFCVGAFIGPLGVAGLLSAALSWRVVFPALGITILLVSALIITRRFPEPSDEEIPVSAPPGEMTPELPTEESSLRQTLIGVYFTMILLYVGVELSMTNWSAEFFVIRLGTAEGAGAMMVALLWIGMFAGRLGLSFFYHGTRQETVLLLLNGISACFLLLMLVSTSRIVSAVFVFCIGVGLSGVYPLVMSLVGKQSRSSVAVGVVSKGGGVGSFSFPFILAFIADRIGLYRAFYFCLFVAVIMLILAAVLHKRLSKP